MIRNFEAISKYDIYSNYNAVLEKKFKDRSLKSFINSLKYNKIKEKAPFLEEFYKKYPYEFEEKKIPENEDELFLKINNSNNLKEENEHKVKTDISKKNELRCSFSTKIYKEPEYPDPFKYHPNYNSIFKKVPSFKIGPKKSGIKNLKKIKGLKDIFQNSNNKDKYNLIYNNINLSDEENKIINNMITIDSKNKYITEPNTNNTENNNNKIKAKENDLNLPLITSTNIVQDLKNDKNKNKNKTLEYNRDNHALRFSKYLPRKIIFGSSNQQVSYVEPYDYKLDNKKTIDFSKMKSRNSKSILNTSSLDVPPVGKYYPKYTLVENNAKNVIFSPFGEKKYTKKNILKKMLGSYKVFSEYETIDNEKLFKNDDLINQQLIINYNLKI